MLGNITITGTLTKIKTILDPEKNPNIKEHPKYRLVFNNVSIKQDGITKKADQAIVLWTAGDGQTKSQRLKKDREFNIEARKYEYTSNDDHFNNKDRWKLEYRATYLNVKPLETHKPKSNRPIQY